MARCSLGSIDLHCIVNRRSLKNFTKAWVAVERSLNSWLQEAEAKAAAAEEKERSINERLTQTLSRINVLEAQLSCLRAEQTHLTRSLEKERQRAAENRQEYLALKEESDTREGRVKQLEEEISELRRKHKDELHQALMHQEFLQQELEREKTTRLEQERAARFPSSVVPDQILIARQKSAAFENGNLSRKISSASSLSSMEESYFLQSTLDSSENFAERRSVVEGTMGPYYMKSVTSSTFEAALRQKRGSLHLICLDWQLIEHGEKDFPCIRGHLLRELKVVGANLKNGWQQTFPRFCQLYAGAQLKMKSSGLRSL